MTERTSGTDVQMIPANDCDILQTIDQIAAWRGITYGQCRAQIADGLIPTYGMPGKSTVFAFKSEITEKLRTVLKPRRMKSAPA